MSRIGRLPIPVPSGVDVTIDGSTGTVHGPKGTPFRAPHPGTPRGRAAGPRTPPRGAAGRPRRPERTRARVWGRGKGRRRGSLPRPARAAAQVIRDTTG